MGEDIHQKSFAKSKLTGKWFDTASIDFDANQEMFKQLIPYRSYMLFSLFGSRRSDWKELEPSGYGIPDFLKNDLPEFAAFHDKTKDWYSYTWFTRKKLLEEIDRYIAELESPEKYYANFDEDYKAEMLQDLNDYPEALKDWKDDAACLKSMLEEIKSKLAEQDLQWTEEIDSIVDGSFDDVVYLFWFDN